ncbi:MAG: hypothetical protein GEU90_06020 [Gemmatimonas sp.]|nr:hypothetical protein [Gemmatimonas sp.]
MNGDRFRGIRRAFRLGAWRTELDEELAFHFDETVRELIAGGMSRPDAVREAIRRFGNRQTYRRELETIDRRAETFRRFGELLKLTAGSARYAARRLRRSTGFAVAIILTFALGIGANATMFMILDRLLFSPPEHIEDPDTVGR